METKKYILGRDQKWAWPKMGVANLKKMKKYEKKMFFEKNFFKRKTLINGNKKNILGRDQKWGVSQKWAWQTLKK